MAIMLPKNSFQRNKDIKRKIFLYFASPPSKSGYLMLRLILLFIIGSVLLWSCSTTEQVQPQPNPWTIKTNPVTKLSGYKANTGGSVVQRGGDVVISKGVCWSRTQQIPTINNFKTIDGAGNSDWSSIIDSLVPQDTIIVRSYVVTGIGTFYGQAEGYRVKIQTSPPSVQTNPVTDARKTSALLTGKIVTDGGANLVERGFILTNTTTQFTQKVQFPILNPDSMDANFDTIMPGLQTNTTYEVKAYARNTDFTSYRYGESRFFFTNGNLPDPFPVVVTDTIKIDTAASSLDSVTANANGFVISSGDFSVLSKGFCFGTSRNPGYYGSRADDPSSPFNPNVDVKIIGLVPGLRYYYRAYARNEAGIGYGEEKSFIAIP